MGVMMNIIYPPLAKGPREELHNSRAGNYNTSIARGYGHPMCDDEHAGYETETQYPCRTGLCDKSHQKMCVNLF